jgi:thiamine-phosphate pyrophosphorylase
MSGNLRHLSVFFHLFLDMIAKLHYLTQDLDGLSHQEQAQIACENGIRWVQLRVKNKPYEEWLQIAGDVKVICIAYKAVLIVNDHVSVAKAVDAHGVHLGKSDMPVAAARKILGKTAIIGGTANTAEDVLRLQQDGADYIGLGPYRFTATKQNLAEILGIEGYEKILRTNHAGVPLIAIGGIQAEDVCTLLDTGVYGVAVSSAINLASDKPAAIRAFIEAVSPRDTSHNH